MAAACRKAEPPNCVAQSRSLVATDIHLMTRRITFQCSCFTKLVSRVIISHYQMRAEYKQCFLRAQNYSHALRHLRVHAGPISLIGLLSGIATQFICPSVGAPGDNGLDN